MNIILVSIISAVLFGVYDLCIKLSAGKINPGLGVVVCQTASALTMGLFVAYQQFIAKSFQPRISTQGIFWVSVAGALIATALVLLLIILGNKSAKATTIMPIVLILRNVTVVLLGVVVLKEQMGFLKTLGIALSLLGVYLIALY